MGWPSVPNHALLFIEYWTVEKSYETVTDDDIFTFFNKEVTEARAKNILRELYLRGYLHRRKETKKRDYEISQERADEFFRELSRMCDFLRKKEKDGEISQERADEVFRELLLRGYLHRKEKGQKKRGPGRYLYSITKEGIKRCDYLREKGYKLWDEETLKKMRRKSPLLYALSEYIRVGYILGVS